MVYKMKNYITLILLWIGSWVCAQQTIEVGKRYSFESKHLNDSVEVWVNLPKNYSETKKYPVLYVLDAEANFTFLTSVLAKFQSGFYSFTPEFIIVALPNLDFNRAEIFSESKKENFTLYLKNEVLPWVKKHYSTNDFKMLIGHSLSGFYAIDLLFHQPEMFNIYVAHDPSIWKNEFELLKLYQNASNRNFQNRKLYITQVGEKQHTESLHDHYTSIKKMDEVLKSMQNSSLDYHYRQYAEEEHSSIPMIGNIDVLRYYFAELDYNFKDLKNNPKLIENAYEALSLKLDFEFVPSLEYLTKLKSYFQKQNQQNLVDLVDQMILKYQ